MADDQTPTDDPDLERRLGSLHRLRDDVPPPPPVHTLTARRHQRRSRWFAAACTVAAAAAVIAAIVVIATRPNDDSSVTADRPPLTVPVVPARLQPIVIPPSNSCYRQIPTDTLDAHGLRVTKVDVQGSTVTVHLVNDSDQTVRFRRSQGAMVATTDRMITSWTDPAMPQALPAYSDVVVKPRERTAVEVDAAFTPCPEVAQSYGADSQPMTLVLTVGFGSDAGLNATLSGPTVAMPVPTRYRGAAETSTSTTEALSGTGNVELPSCGDALPAETATEHGLEVALTGEQAPGWVGVRVTNRGAHDMAVLSMVSFLVREERGKVTSVPTSTIPNGAVQTIHVAPGESATVRLRVWDTTCRPPRALLTGTQTMTPVLQIGDLGLPGSSSTPRLSVVAGPSMTVQLDPGGTLPATTTPH